MLSRINRELKHLATDPATGIGAWPKDDNVRVLEGQIQGPEDSPYHGGVFNLNITIPPRYPFEPPAIQFRTKIYHPNIDSQGRICLDSLKMPPTGSWQPSLNLNQLLSQIRLLMAEPNPDDPLMPDINQIFVMNPKAFHKTAKDWTAKFARPDQEQSTNKGGVEQQESFTRDCEPELNRKRKMESIVAGSISNTSPRPQDQSGSDSSSSSESSSSECSDTESESGDVEDAAIRPKRAKIQ